MNNLADIILDAANYIETSLKSLSGVDEVSSSMSISSTYINRAFKRYLGYTATDYLKMRKITQGIRAGTMGRGNIIDIAFEYGFNSHEVFSRSCRRYFKKSPKELIKEESWKGCMALSGDSVWYLTNLKHIEVSRVRLSKLTLSQCDRGDFKVYINSSLFRGKRDELIWEAERTYKLIPSGIYELYSIARSREYDKLCSYLIQSSINNCAVVEYKSRERVLFYRAIS